MVDIVFTANRAAAGEMQRSGAQYAEIAAVLFAKQYGKPEHLGHGPTGLSPDGERVITDLYLWKTSDNGLILTRGKQSPQDGAQIVQWGMSPGTYANALLVKFNRI